MNDVKQDEPYICRTFSVPEHLRAENKRDWGIEGICDRKVGLKIKLSGFTKREAELVLAALLQARDEKEANNE